MRVEVEIKNSYLAAIYYTGLLASSKARATGSWRRMFLYQHQRQQRYNKYSVHLAVHTNDRGWIWTCLIFDQPKPVGEIVDCGIRIGRRRLAEAKDASGLGGL